jgi:hypothetical protein
MAALVPLAPLALGVLLLLLLWVRLKSFSYRLTNERLFSPSRLVGEACE